VAFYRFHHISRACQVSNRCYSCTTSITDPAAATVHSLGGSWITGSIFFNNFPGFNDLVFGNGNDLGGWLLDLPFATPDGTDIFSEKNQYFFGSILWSVMAKAGTGMYVFIGFQRALRVSLLARRDTSITDPWARMISYRFLNQTSRDNIFTNDTAHGAGQLWSRIPDIPAFQQHLLPVPILVTDSRPSGSNDTRVLGLDSTVYEVRLQRRSF